MLWKSCVNDLLVSLCVSMSYSMPSSMERLCNGSLMYLRCPRVWSLLIGQELSRAGRAVSQLGMLYSATRYCLVLCHHWVTAAVTMMWARSSWKVSSNRLLCICWVCFIQMFLWCRCRVLFLFSFTYITHKFDSEFSSPFCQ